MIQKSRVRLFAVGLVLIAVLAGALVRQWWWGPGLFSAAIGAYLVWWATAGRGRWCRTCKTFRIRP